MRPSAKRQAEEIREMEISLGVDVEHRQKGRERVNIRLQ